MEKECVLLEYGVLLDKDHKEYGCYSTVYDKKHGYYDEGQALYVLEALEHAFKTGCEYVSKGVVNTYAIITKQGPFDIDSKNYNEQDLIKGECISDIQEVDYSEKNIIFKAVKVNEDEIEVSSEDGFIFDCLFYSKNDKDKIHYYEAEASIVIDNTPMAMEEVKLELLSVFNVHGNDIEIDGENPKPAIYDVTIELVQKHPAPNEICKDDVDHLIKIKFVSLCGELDTENNANDNIKEILSNLHLIHEIKKVKNRNNKDS